MVPSERNDVATFIDHAMQKEYHCNAHELPDIVFVGRQGDTLVGAMAISLGGQTPLPIEKTYTLDYGSFPWPFVRFRTAQFGRWVATVPNLSESLFYVTVQYALARGRRWGIGEMKKKVIRRFTRMGIGIIPLRGAPILENIQPEVRPYYLLPPAPTPCFVCLRDARRVLRRKVASLVSRDAVEIL